MVLLDLPQIYYPVVNATDEDRTSYNSKVVGEDYRVSALFRKLTALRRPRDATADISLSFFLGFLNVLVVLSSPARAASSRRGCEIYLFFDRTMMFSQTVRTYLGFTAGYD